MVRLKWIILTRCSQVSMIEWLNWFVLMLLIGVAIFLLIPTLDQLETIKDSQQTQVVTKPKQQQSKAREDDFLKNMPKVIEASDAIHSVFQIAGEHDLNIEKITYKPQIKPSENVVRYSFDFGVEGGYLDIKAFLSELLAAEPYLSIENMSLQREHIEARTVNAVLKLNLFLNHE